MSLNAFIIGVIALLFGYNFAATKWQDYQKKKLQKRRQQRRY